MIAPGYFTFITLFVFIVGFYFGYLKKYTKGIFFCILLIPLETIYIKGIGLNIFAVFGVLSGVLITYPALLAPRVYKKHIIYLQIAVFISFLISLYNLGQSEITWFEGKLIEGTIPKFILYYLGSIVFFNLIINTTKTIEDIYKYLLALILSCFFLFVSFVGSYTLKFGSMPIFLQTVNSGGNVYFDLARFSGLWGDYELTNEYSFVIFFVSIVMIIVEKKIKYQRLIAFAGIIMAVPIAVSTGTRSLVVMILLSFFLFIGFILLRRKISIIYKVGVISTLLIAFAVLYYFFTTSEILYERVLDSIYSSSNFMNDPNIFTFEKIINRNYSGTYQDILDVGGYFGNGPFFVSEVKGSSMVYHCLYYQLVINFGIIGLTIFISFIYKMLKDLLIKSYKYKSVLISSLFVLTITLLVDQIKINFLRENSMHIVYWLLFAIIVTINRGIIDLPSTNKN